MRWRVLVAVCVSCAVTAMVWWLRAGRNDSRPVRALPAPTAPALAIDAGIAAFPTVAIPCVVDPPTLHAAGELPVLCGYDGACLALDGHTAHVTTQPADDPDRRANVHAGTPPTLCIGDRCAPLGRKLAAEIGDTAQVAATADLRAVVIGTTLWSVTGDRALAPPSPPRTKEDRGPPTGFSLNGVAVIGNAVRFDWINCAADECTRSAIVDSAGRDLHQTIGGGQGEAIRLSEQFYVQLSVTGDAELLDASGHLRSQRAFASDRGVALGLVRLADDKFAVLARIDDVEPISYVVHVADVSADQATIWNSRGQYVAACELRKSAK